MKRICSIMACALFVACTPAVRLLDAEEGLTEYVQSSAGLSVRYPKTVSFDETCDNLTVSSSEQNGTISFQTWAGPIDCPTVGETFVTIETQRAEDEIDVRDFIGRIFSPDCLIVEKNTLVKHGDETTVFFTENRNPPADGPDFTCRFVEWNQDAGVVWYSVLADKTGGAYDWPSLTGIKTDGGWEGGWDFFIVDSIRFKR